MGSRPGSIIEKLEFALFSMAYLKGPILRSQKKKAIYREFQLFNNRAQPNGYLINVGEETEEELSMENISCLTQISIDWSCQSRTES